MKKTLAISSVLLALVLLNGCSQQSDTQEYKSASTLSFTYPTEVCGPENEKCSPIVLTEDESSITLEASELGVFKIYYGTNIADEDSVDDFLRTALNNDLCKIDRGSTRMFGETTIKNIFLAEGCSLYGPAYDEYSIEHPDAVGLSGKTRTYWAVDSQEMIVYELGRGGECSFANCAAEEEISHSINLGGINVSEESMKGL